MVTNPFNEGVSVEIRGDSSQLDAAVGNAVASLGSLKKAAAAASVALGALAVGGLGVAAKSAADFEEQMVEVEKVTDPQTAEEMREEIMAMAAEMPVAQSELAGIAAQAGRFGVEGPENIRQFTESVAQMAVATDLSTEQAGEAFARMTTLMDEPIDNVQNLGDAVNGLSNNMATSASEITNASTRSSGALAQLGLESESILALNASMNEVSASSRIAGTRLRRFAQELQDPGKTEDLAAALGMTTEEFRTMREESPNELMQQLVSTFAEGGDQADMLRRTLSTTSRQALAGLAQNTEGWAEAQEVANEQMGEGESLQEEYTTAADTFNAKLQVTKNRLRNIGITIGEELLPPLSNFVGSLNEGLVAFEAWIEGSEEGNEQTQAFAEGMEDLADAVEEHFERVERVFDRNLEDILRQTQVVLEDILGFWDAHSDTIMTIVESAWTIISTVLVGALDSIMSLTSAFLAILRGDWDQAWTEITSLFDRQMGRIQTIAENLGPLIISAVEMTINGLVAAFRHLVAIVITNQDSLIKSLFRNASSWILNNGRSVISSAFDKVVDTIQDTLSWLTGTGDDSLVGDIVSAFDSIGGRLASIFQSAFSGLQSTINNALGLPWVIELPSIELPNGDTLGGGELKVPRFGGSGTASSSDYSVDPSDIGESIDNAQDRGDQLEEEFQQGGGGGIPAPSPDNPLREIGFGGLAKGGIATRPTIAALAEKGRPEAVIPLDKLGSMGGGTQVVIENVHASGQEEGRQAGQAIKRELEMQGV